MNPTVSVLVVDDNAELRDVVVDAIHSADVHVLEAKNGREALDQILAHGLPDLILLDMNMPVMNGWEFAKELRARDLWTAPVIVITAAYDAERSAQEIGAAGFLGKPFELNILLSTVARYRRAREPEPVRGTVQP